jgi:Rrf2 family cysteine metabolism transcriptional repressor
MRLSTRGRYGTRLMVDLAQHYAEGPIPLAEIAKRQDLSAKYLEQLIMLLKGAGLIRSVRGRRGGYVLAKKPAQISVGEIVEALEGKLSLVDCVLDPDLCYRAEECPTRDIWVGITDVVKKELYSLSLGDILARSTTVDELLQSTD